MAWPHDIEVPEDLPVFIDMTIYPDGWEISIDLRKGEPARLRRLLEHLGISTEENDRFVYPTHFDYGEDLGQIKPVLQDLLDKIATVEDLS